MLVIIVSPAISEEHDAPFGFRTKVEAEETRAQLFLT